jgi:hypothetical protein
MIKVRAGCGNLDVVREGENLSPARGCSGSSYPPSPHLCPVGGLVIIHVYVIEGGDQSPYGSV